MSIGMEQLQHFIVGLSASGKKPVSLDFACRLVYHSGYCFGVFEIVLSGFFAQSCVEKAFESRRIRIVNVQSQFHL
jgi:hypothetical protein